MTFHFSCDGNILFRESDEFRDQEDFWENKKAMEKKLADNINKAIIEEFGSDPLEGNTNAQKKALRNQFNY